MLGIGQGLLGIGAFKQRLPRPEEALPGREAPLPLHNAHYVNGQPLRGDFAGLAVLDVGLGCFWGAERKFWQLPGVVTTAVGYQGGTTPNPTCCVRKNSGYWLPRPSAIGTTTPVDLTAGTSGCPRSWYATPALRR